MPKKGQKLRAGSLKGGKSQHFKGKRGSGSRFKDCKSKARARGARNPAGMCAAMGRAKYGKKGFSKMGAKGRRRH